MRANCRIFLFGLLSIIFISSNAWAGGSVRVRFIAPQDGAEVTSPVKVVMGTDGLTVAPAGEVKAGVGHHHLIVDGGPIKLGDVIPADATHIHFGKGQTEADIPLTPGRHTLTLQFADGAHHSYGPELAATITIYVK